MTQTTRTLTMTPPRFENTSQRSGMILILLELLKSGRLILPIVSYQYHGTILSHHEIEFHAYPSTLHQTC